MGQFDLTGRLAAVTGASRGIGQAIAVSLAAAGADIVGVSSTAQQDATRRLVESAGRRYYSLGADFGDAEHVAALTDSLVELGDPLDILVNNAGTIRRAPAVDHSIADWEHVLRVNLTSQFQLTQAVGARMLERRQGKIIFVGSLLSFQGGINVAGYTASKSGVVGLTRLLANEWSEGGVNVNAIAPGYIATDNTATLQADNEREAAILSRIPAGRWGQPDDLGGAAVFLASAASDYVHGIVLPVDGGWLSR